VTRGFYEPAELVSRLGAKQVGRILPVELAVLALAGCRVHNPTRKRGIGLSPSLTRRVMICTLIYETRLNQHPVRPGSRATESGLAPERLTLLSEK
jgi:hypothetical protein